MALDLLVQPEEPDSSCGSSVPVETQCTLCTCYLKSVAQLKTSRETLQHNLDEAQRKFLEFQKETQGEILEEKIAKERMSEMGDLQIELEFLKAQLTLYQSQSNVSLSTNNKRLERSSREFKNSSCQVELEKNSRIERDCQTDIEEIVVSPSLSVVISTNSNAITAAGSSKKKTRTVQYVCGLPPLPRLQSPASIASKPGSLSPPIWPHSAINETTVSKLDHDNAHEDKDVEKQVSGNESLQTIMTRQYVAHILSGRSSPLLDKHSPQMKQKTKTNTTSGSGWSKTYAPVEDPDREKASKSIWRPTKLGIQQASTPLSSNSELPPNLKRKAADDLDFVHQDEEVAALKKLRFSKKTPSSVDLLPQTAGSTIASTFLANMNHSASSLTQARDSSLNFQTSLRMYIESLLASYPRYDPEFKPDSRRNPVRVRRDLLNNAYGMGTQQMLAQINPARNPLPSGALSRRERRIMFPNLDRNPDLPRQPGDSGVLFTARPEGELTLEGCSVFVKKESKNALWDYMGEYKIFPKGKIGGRGNGRGWYEQLPSKVQRSIEKDILGKKKHEHYRERIAHRLSVAKVNGTDIGDALVRGDEEINIIFLECIGYDDYFANDMLRHLNQNDGNDRKGKDKTKTEIIGEARNLRGKGSRTRMTQVIQGEHAGSTELGAFLRHRTALPTSPPATFSENLDFDSDGALTELEE
ncbi:MAG: hypothetical protein NXY57DRAFT_997000 [Lentinula lateritia]|nr:MAG: hypothetical protein NXY57DRAFT_997000 [Lentinula lateritia]